MFDVKTVRRNGRAAAGVLFGALVALATTGGLGTAAPATKMPMATGRVTYQMSGPMKGQMVVSWCESGKKFRQDTKMTGTPPMPPGAAPGMPKPKPMTMQTWALSDGKDLYTLIPRAGKQVMRVKGAGAGSGSGSAPKGLGEMLGQFKGAKVVGKATVLGRPCEIRSAQGAKAWLWNGLPLRIEMQMGPQMPKITMLATKLETAPTLSPSLFKVPAGYQVKDMPAGGPGGMRPGMPH